MSRPSDLGIDDLFASARGDSPPPDVTDEVWRRVSAAAVPAGAAAGAAVSGLKTAASSSGSYGAAFGLLFGAAGAAMLMQVSGAFDGPPPRHASRAEPARAVLAKGRGASSLDEAPVRGRAAAPPPPALDVVPSSHASSVKSATAEASSLAREARLVTDARQALLRDDAARAFELMREARGLAVRALEPEEMRRAARALRALGRVDEALALELELRRRSER